jgi:RNA polymerase primary sigma factor
MKEYKIEIKIKNNLLYQKILDTGCKSVAGFCRKYKLHQQQVGEIIRMQRPLIDSDGKWILIVNRLCEVFSCEPEDIITEEQKYIIENKKIELYADAQELAFLANNSDKFSSIEYVDDEIDSVTINKELMEQLSYLKPREKKVLEMRFGINGKKDCSLDEVSKEFNITREMVRQIEFKALRKMNHPKRSGKLLDMLGWENKNNTI